MSTSARPEPRRRAFVPALLQYEVSVSLDDWTIAEEPVAEARWHDLAADLVRDILVQHAADVGMNAQGARNLAVRFEESRPNVGVDPDVCVISPAAPEGDALDSLCLWREGHTPPLVAVEIVSTNNPRKDYVVAPDKYAVCGVRELWVFDPHLAGPKAHGGPFRIQLWARDEDGRFSRIYAGEGPVRSPTLGGWLFAVSEGQRLRIADDAQGTVWWPTPAEAERAGREAERRAKDEAIARIADLEAALTAAGRSPAG